MPPAIASELARSLARFQIGETHAHILAGLVSALGGELLRATWTEHTLRALKIPRRELSARLSALVLEGAR